MNSHIVAAVLIIGGVGVIKAYSAKPAKPITPVIIGSYVLLLLLALLDFFGGGLSQVASALAMLAVVTVILTEFPWQTAISLVQGKSG